MDLNCLYLDFQMLFVVVIIEEVLNVKLIDAILMVKFIQFVTSLEFIINWVKEFKW